MYAILSLLLQSRYRTFISSKKVFLYLFVVNPLPSPSAPGNHCIFSDPRVLLFLRMSYKWHHIVCNHLCFTSFTSYNIFEIDLGYYMDKQFLFCCFIIILLYRHITAYHSPLDVRFGFFPFFTIINKPTKNIHTKVFVQTFVFGFRRVNPQKWGCCDMSKFIYII